MKNKYLNKKDIEKKYKNRRIGLAVAQGVDAFGTVGGVAASFGAGFALEDPGYYLVGTGIGAAGIIGYNLLDKIRKNKNPQKEEKEIHDLRKKFKDENIPLEDF